MGGKVTSQLSQETRDLLKENRKFFEALVPALQKAELGFKGVDPEARTETVALENGDVQVTFIYPLDNDGDQANGRLYVRDRFVFDKAEKELKNFHRDFDYNGKGNREQWKAWLKQIQASGQPTAEAYKQFAVTAAGTYSRPIDGEILKFFQEKVKQHGLDIKAELPPEKQALNIINEIVPYLQEEGLRIMMGDPNTHYTLIRGQGVTKLIFSYMVDDGDEKTSGKLQMRDTFIFQDTGDLVGFDRKWDVEPGATPENVWTERATRLDKQAKPSLEVAKGFIKDIYPRVLDFHPVHVQAEAPPPLPPPPGGYEEMTPAKFDGMLEHMAQAKKAVPATQMEPELLSLFGAKNPYFAPLQALLKPEIELGGNLRPKVNVTGEGTNKVVQFELTLSEGAWAEEREGSIKYEERFIYENGKLKDVQRHWKVNGPDAEGRLKAVVEKLEAGKASLPQKGTREMAYFGLALLQYSAPDVLYSNLPKALDDATLDEETRGLHRAFAEIHKNLDPVLSLDGVDPVFRNRMLRVLNAIEHKDVETIQSTMQAIMQTEAQAAQHAAPDDKKRHEDRLLVATVITLLMNGETHAALQGIQHLKSPALERALKGPVEGILRKKQLVEGLDVHMRVALDRVGQRVHDSKAWTYRGPKVDGEAEAKIVEALFKKALAQSKDSKAKNSLELLNELNASGTLSAEEKVACERVLADPISERVASIEQERSRDIQAKYYFELARGDLFEGGLIAASQWLTRKVIMEKMPKSRSLESLEVLHTFGGELINTQLAVKANAETEKAVSAALEVYHKSAEEFQKQHPAVYEAITNDPDISSAYGAFDSTKSLIEKAANHVAGKKDQALLKVLAELTDLNEQEKFIRDILVTDPTVQAFAKIAEQPDREKRMAAYGALLDEIAKTPEMKTTAEKLKAALTSEKFPHEAGFEALSIIFPLAASPLLMTAQAAEEKLVRAKVTEEHNAKAGKDSKLQLGGLEGLFAKARQKASGHPDETAFAIIKGLKDEELNAEERQARDLLVKDKFLEKVSEVVMEPKPEERAKRYKAIIEEMGALAKKGQEVEAAMMLASEPSAENRAKMIEGLNKAAKPGQPVDPIVPKLEEIAKEADPAKRLQLVEAMKGGQDFAAVGFAQSGMWLEQRLMTGKIPDPVSLMPNPMLEEEAAKFAKEAQQFLAVTEGGGHFGTKIGYGMPHFTKEITKPTMLAAMVAGGFFGAATELRVLNSLKTWGTFGRGASVVAGVSGVAFAFTLSHKTFDSAFYSSQGQWDHFNRDVASNILLFGGMRFGHFAVGSFSQRVLASGKAGSFFGSRVAGQPGFAFRTTPTGRIDPTGIGGTGVPQLTAAGKTVTGMFNHAAGVGGMMGSGYVSRALGWQPKNNQDWRGNLADALIGYTQARVGFSVANRATGGRYQQGIAALKMQVHQLNATSEGAFAGESAGLKRLFGSGARDLQLTDLAAGKENHGISLEPGKSKELDLILFGTEGERVKLRKNSEGDLYLVDTRTPSEPKEKDPATANDNTATPPAEPLAPLVTIDGKPLEPGKEVKLGEGQVIISGSREFGLSLPGKSPLILEFGGIPREHQLSLARDIAKAKDFADLMKRLKDAPNEGADLVRGVVQAALDGRILVASLPVEMGIQGRVMDLMRAEVAKVNKEMSLDGFELDAEFTHPKWSRLEKDFHLAREAYTLKNMIAQAQDLPHLLFILNHSRLGLVEGLSISAAKSHVELEFLQSRKADVKQAAEKAQKKLEELQEQAADAEQAKKDPELANKIKESETRLAQLAQVSLMVDLQLAMAMQQAEGLGELGRTAGLEQKVKDLRERGQNPLKDSLSEKESNALLQLVKKNLEFNVPEDVQTAQTLLRYHLDNATPKAKKLLYYASPAAKELALQIYFGQQTSREIPELAAARLVAWLGQAGTPAELRATYRGMREAGNYRLTAKSRLEAVISKTEADSNPDSGAYSFLRSRPQSEEVVDILVKPEEVKEQIEQAKDYFQNQHPDRGSNLFYNSEGSSLTQRILHPLGGTEVRVEMNAEGQPKKIVIRYAAKDAQQALGSKFEKAKEALESLADELKVKVDIQPIDAQKFAAALPEKAGEVGKWVGFFSGAHDKPLARKLEARGYKKKFQPERQPEPKAANKTDLPAWLSELIKNNFEGAEFVGNKEIREAAAVDQALSDLGLTREEIFNDPSLPEKKFKEFADKFRSEENPDAKPEDLEQVKARLKAAEDHLDTLGKIIEAAKVKDAEKKQQAAEDARPLPVRVVTGLGRSILSVGHGIWYGKAGKPKAPKVEKAKESKPATKVETPDSITKPVQLEAEAFFNGVDPRVGEIPTKVKGQKQIFNEVGDPIGETHLCAGGEKGKVAFKAKDGSLVSAKTTEGKRESQQDASLLSTFTLPDGTEVKIVAGADGAGGHGGGWIASSVFLHGVHARVAEAAREGRTPLAGELFEAGVKAQDAQKALAKEAVSELVKAENPDHTAIRMKRLYADSTGTGYVIVIVGDQATVATAGDAMVTWSRPTAEGRFETLGFSDVEVIGSSVISNAISVNQPKLYHIEGLKTGDRLTGGSDGGWEGLVGIGYKSQGSLVGRTNGAEPTNQATFKNLHEALKETQGQEGAAEKLHDKALDNMAEEGIAPTDGRAGPDNILMSSYEQGSAGSSPKLKLPEGYKPLEAVEPNGPKEGPTGPEGNGGGTPPENPPAGNPGEPAGNAPPSGAEAKPAAPSPGADAKGGNPAAVATPTTAPKTVRWSIPVKAASVEHFIQKFPGRVSPDGIFIPTQKLQPVGTKVKFEMRLKAGSPLLVGEGEVVLSRDSDPANPGKKAGMAVKFTDLTPESRVILDKMVEAQKKGDELRAEKEAAAAKPAVEKTPEPQAIIPPSHIYHGLSMAEKFSAFHELILEAAGSKPGRVDLVLELDLGGHLEIPGQQGAKMKLPLTVVDGTRIELKSSLREALGNAVGKEKGVEMREAMQEILGLEKAAESVPDSHFRITPTVDPRVLVQNRGAVGSSNGYRRGVLYLTPAGKIVTHGLAKPNFQIPRGTPVPAETPAGTSPVEVIMVGDKVVWHRQSAQLNPAQEAVLLAMSEGKEQILAREPYAVDAILGEGLGRMAMDLAGQILHGLKGARRQAVALDFNVVRQADGNLRALSAAKVNGYSQVGKIRIHLKADEQASRLGHLDALGEMNFEISSDVPQREAVTDILGFLRNRFLEQGVEALPDGRVVRPASGRASQSPLPN